MLKTAVFLSTIPTLAMVLTIWAILLSNEAAEFIFKLKIV